MYLLIEAINADITPLPHLTGIVLQITYDGVIIAGAPIGTQEFIEAFAAIKLALAKQRFDATVRLAAEDPQAATRILRSSSNAALDYFVRVTPTSSILYTITQFDKYMAEAIRAIVKTQFTTIPMSDPNDLERAVFITTLPIKFGGLGLTRLADKAHAAHLTSVREHKDHPMLKPHIAPLTPQLRTNHDAICIMLGFNNGSVDPRSPFAAILPMNANDILTDTRHARVNKRTKNQRAGVYGQILNGIQDQRRLSLRVQARFNFPATEKTRPAKDYDTIHLLSITARSQLSRCFACPLWKSRNRIPAEKFVRFLRFYLLLPQPGTWSPLVLTPTIPYPVERCNCRHQREGDYFLDHNGDHAAACPSTHFGYSWLHNNVRDLFASYARQAGAQARTEPSLISLLNGKFASAHLATMLPKNRSQGRRSAALAITELLNERLPAATSPAEQNEILQAANNIASSYAGSNDHAEDTLRIDLEIIPEDGSPPLWIDVTTGHCTAASYRASTLHFLTNELNEELVARHNGTPNRLQGEPSPCIMQASTSKHTKYAPLLALAKSQMIRRHGGRKTMPVFRAPALRDLVTKAKCPKTHLNSLKTSHAWCGEKPREHPHVEMQKGLMPFRQTSGLA